MHNASLLESLNDKQQQAVSAPPNHLLVLAGAGSGKTRVLVHRIAWLMQAYQCSPWSILAVTFTNKAAAEMRGRIDELVGTGASGMWIGTFHGLAHRLLRTHYQEVNLPQAFQILDADDQLRLVRRTMRDLNIDEKKLPPKQAVWYINGKKDEGLRPKDVEALDFTETNLLQIYQTYQMTCDRAGLVDFAEILLRSFELLRDHATVREHYQRRFQHILVDEFQDTNAIQYAWMCLLAGHSTSNVMIVGDDDQSIYGWRGAQVENIQRFIDQFQPETIRLEQNYRSTGNILKAANMLIENNSGRLGKNLWTEDAEGEAIDVYAAYNELDEAKYIAANISKWRELGGTLSETAILYRNNAQSRVLEEALLHESLPYRIYGGMKFFERQEIKDALSYMRLIASRKDDAAFERIINTPTRGIGERTVAMIRDTARTMTETLWEASLRLLEEKHLSGRAANAVKAFVQLIDALDDDTYELQLHAQADHVIWHSGLKAMYQAEKGEKARNRLDNLEELVTACRQFDPEASEAEMEPLEAFLAQVALESGEGQADEFEDAVQMMTLHSAKGLEFPLVFLGGVEEGMFPSLQSAEDSQRLEEERRLCYVGITRAMQKLHICYAESRRVYGQTKLHRPSRFINELPEECLNEIRLKTKVSRPVSDFSARESHYFEPSHAPQHVSKRNVATNNMEAQQAGFSIGQKVSHPKFGQGFIMNSEGSGEHLVLHIVFDNIGMKRLQAKVAPLTPLS